MAPPGGRTAGKGSDAPLPLAPVSWELFHPPGLGWPQLASAGPRSPSSPGLRRHPMAPLSPVHCSGPSPLESRPACPSPCPQGRQSPWLPTADLRWPNLRPCLLPGPSPSLGPATHSWPPSRKEGESLSPPPQPMSPGPGDLTSHPRCEPRPGVGTPPYKCSQTQAAWPEPWAWTGSSRWGEDRLGPAWAEWQGPRESRGHLSTAHVLTAWLLGTWPTTRGLDELRPGVSWALRPLAAPRGRACGLSPGWLSAS